MKKQFKYYAACWGVLAVLYQVVVFAVRPLPGFTASYDARFWVAYVFTTAAFLGQLACAYAAFRAKNLDKFFLNLPLITVSYACTAALAVCGCICMLIPRFPAWATVVLCGLIFAFGVIAVVQAKASADIISQTDEKVRRQTSFVRTLTAELDTLANRTRSDAVRSQVKAAYEAVRYSDPVSHEALAELEAQIGAQADALAQAVAEDDAAAAERAAAELTLLMKERGQKCRLLK